MLKHALANWKTTSAGLVMVIGATVHLVYAIREKEANENTWTISLTSVVAGLGLILAGDAGASVSKTDVKTDENTGFLRNVDAPPDDTTKPK